jgi:hypothetical protein
MSKTISELRRELENMNNGHRHRIPTEAAKDKVLQRGHQIAKKKMRTQCSEERSGEEKKRDRA